MSAVFLTTMGSLYSGNGINIKAVSTGEEGWIYLAGIDYSSSDIYGYNNALTVLGYKDGQLAWKQDFHDRGFGSFEAITFKNGYVYAAGAISTEFNGDDLSFIDNIPVTPPEKIAVDPDLASLYATKNPWFFQDPTYPIYVKLNGDTGSVQFANVLPSPNVQGDDRFRTIGVDSMGDVYVAGGGWNPGIDPDNSFENASFYWFTRKFSANGEQLWEKPGAEAVVLDPTSDTPYLTRYQDQVVRLDSETGEDLDTYYTGLPYIPKVVTRGIHTFVLDESGNIFTIANENRWDSVISDFSRQSNGLLVKINSSGNVDWQTRFGLPTDSGLLPVPNSNSYYGSLAYCQPNSLVFSPTGHLLISGEFAGNLDFLGDKSTYGGTDGFILEVDPSTGDILSSKIIGGEKNESIAQLLFQPIFDKLTGTVTGYNTIIAGSFETRRYSLEGHDEKDIYLITEEGFQLVGNALENRISGGGGDDFIFAGLGNDELIGGLGNDYLDGGDGNDVASYKYSKSQVTVDLRKGLAFGADIGIDTLNSIEALVGGSASDRLIGDIAGNKILGGLGNDTIDGDDGDDELYAGDGDDVVKGGRGKDVIIGGDGAGNDAYDGGSGADTVKYTSAVAGIWVNLSAASDQARSLTSDDSGIGTDQLRNIENVIAGNFSDVIVGDGNANELAGMDGDDILQGGFGNDILDGGEGIDRAVFTGELSDYVVSFQQSNGITITTLTDKRVYGEGVDQLIDIEFVQFGDKVYQLAAGNLTETPLAPSELYDILAANPSSIPVSIASRTTEEILADLDGAMSRQALVTNLSARALDPQIAAKLASLGYTVGTNLKDNLNAGDDDAWLLGLGGRDTLTGGDGNDNLDGGEGIDSLSGGKGNDRYYVDHVLDQITELAANNTPEQQIFSMGNYNDVVVASVSYKLGANVAVEDMIAVGNLVTQHSTDPLINLTGNDLAQGLLGNDNINVLSGMGGDDILIGLGGSDFLFGGAGNDGLIGGSGNDRLFGDRGDDVMVFSVGDIAEGSGFYYEPFEMTWGGGVDRADGGEGTDAVFISTQDFDANLITISRFAGRAYGNDGYRFVVRNALGDEMHLKNIEQVWVGQINELSDSGPLVYSLSDKATGTSGNDWIGGSQYGDTLRGLMGDDLLQGMAGADRLYGGAGNDKLFGGTGRDSFIFDTQAGTLNIDEIIDFNSSEDILAFKASVFTGLQRQGKTIKPGQFASGVGLTTAQNEAHRLIYDTATGDLFYDVDGLGGVDAVQVASLVNMPNLEFRHIQILL